MTKAEKLAWKEKRVAELKEIQHEKRKREMRRHRILRGSKKLSGSELILYKNACETYAEKMAAFKAGKVVKGKGKNKKVFIKPHTPQPSFKAICKSYGLECPAGAR